MTALPDVPRWDIDGFMRAMLASDDGEYVLHVDHLTAMQQQYERGYREGLEKALAADELIAWLHARFQFEYDECDHGVYTGGPNDGKPYAMCERIGTALSASRIQRLIDGGGQG